MTIIIRSAHPHHGIPLPDAIALNCKFFFMEKILMAVNPGQMDTKTIDFACYIANLTHSKLKALFLHGSDENAAMFHEACRNRGVNTNIQIEHGVPADDLLSESRFADLLIIRPGLTSDHGKS